MDTFKQASSGIHVSHGHTQETSERFRVSRGHTNAWWWRIRVSPGHFHVSHGHTHVSHGHMHAMVDGIRVSHGHTRALKLLVMPRRERSHPAAAKFGAIIRRLRTARGWTLRDLGRKADMNPTYLGFLERGENVPTLATILHMAKLFDVDAFEIVREVEGKQR